VELFVDGRPVESVIGSLDEAVERDVHGVDQLAHPFLQRSVVFPRPVRSSPEAAATR
jgi:hypothetical protein